MNPCPRELDIQRLHDGELPSNDRRLLEEHLATCPICAEERASLQRFSRQFQALPIASMPAEVKRRARSAWSHRSQRDIERLVAWFSAAAAIVLVGSLLYAPADEERTIVTMSSSPASWELAAITPGEALDRESDTMRFALWMNAGLSGNTSRDSVVPTTQTR